MYVTHIMNVVKMLKQLTKKVLSVFFGIMEEISRSREWDGWMDRKSENLMPPAMAVPGMEE